MLNLRKEELFGETEGFVFAVQNRVVNARNYIVIELGDYKCQRCNKLPEAIEHNTGS